MTRAFLFSFVISLLNAVISGADEPTTLTPSRVKLSENRVNEDWILWESNPESDFTLQQGKFLCMSESPTGEIWIGTSSGRLLSMTNDKWTLQADLHRTQITSIATAGPDTVWLATSDGIRRLDRDVNAWKVTAFRTYFEGQPGFFSGPAFVPNREAVRLWGYVDKIYVPHWKNTYSPFVISNEHGFFAFQKLHELWHHYLPHYWGANSPWLDTRELSPHRRPTCVIEDVDANLWIGTQWDGIARLNAQARDYHTRPPEDNKKDGTEFTFIDSKAVGAEFDEVVSLASGVDKGVWAIVASKDQHKTVARFDGDAWTTMSLPEKFGRVNCITEVKSGVILLGLNGAETQSLVSIDWSSRKIQNIRGPEYIFEIRSLPDGRILAASELGLYKTVKTIGN